MEIKNEDKRWIVKEPGNPLNVRQMAQELGIDQVLANLLVQRGVTTFDGARDFFRPDLSKLYDPFLMRDMDVAVERLHKAIENNENILIYGDYDVDGIVSAIYEIRDMSADKRHQMGIRGKEYILRTSTYQILAQNFADLFSEGE